jgi:hypothetical protein
VRRLLKFLPLLAPLIALVLLGAKFVRTMNHEHEQLAGSNSVRLLQPVIQIDPRARLCQPVLAPKDAATAQFYTAPTGPTGPPLTMTLRGAHRTLARSHIAGGWLGGVARFHFPVLRTTYPEARICLTAGGRHPIAFSGLPIGAPTRTTVDGRAQRASITIQFFRQGKGNWWSILPTIAHRAGILRGSLAGAWGFWLAAALALLAGIGSLGIVLGGRR